MQVSTESRRASDSLKLGLQVVGSHPTQVLGAELRSSVRAASVVNH